MLSEGVLKKIRLGELAICLGGFPIRLGELAICEGKFFWLHTCANQNGQPTTTTRTTTTKSPDAAATLQTQRAR